MTTHENRGPVDAGAQSAEHEHAGTASGARLELAVSAYIELEALLGLVPLVDGETLHALRGLSMRARDLLGVIYGCAIDPSWSNAEEDARTLYGHTKGCLGGAR